MEYCIYEIGVVSLESLAGWIGQSGPVLQASPYRFGSSIFLVLMSRRDKVKCYSDTAHRPETIAFPKEFFTFSIPY